MTCTAILIIVLSYIQINSKHSLMAYARPHASNFGVKSNYYSEKTIYQSLIDINERQGVINFLQRGVIKGVNMGLWDR